MPSRDDVVAFAVAVFRSAEEHDVKYPAAAFAYYGFVAFLPLLVLAVGLLDRAAVVRLDRSLPQLLTPEAQLLVYESLAVASGRTGATLFAIGVFAWSGANMTVAFQTIVERVEGLDGRTWGEQLRDAAGIFASLCLAVGSVVFTEGFVAARSTVPFVTWLAPGVLLVTLTLAFLPLYFISSHVVTDLVSALPGAITAALGWTSLVTGVVFYASNAGQYALYGILSGVILIFTSLYIAAAALMLGVVVNATVAEFRERSASAGD